jgi:hypothetical protein
VGILTLLGACCAVNVLQLLVAQASRQLATALFSKPKLRTPPAKIIYSSNPRGINGNQQVCNTCNDDLGAAASNSNGQHQLISHPPGDDYEGGEGVSSFLRWASSSRSGPGRCGGEGEMEFSLQPRLLINFATERDLLMTDRPKTRITQHWKCVRNASARKRALLMCVLIMRLQIGIFCAPAKPLRARTSTHRERERRGRERKKSRARDKEENEKIIPETIESYPPRYAVRPVETPISHWGLTYDSNNSHLEIKRVIAIYVVGQGCYGQCESRVR